MRATLIARDSGLADRIVAARKLWSFLHLLWSKGVPPVGGTIRSKIWRNCFGRKDPRNLPSHAIGEAPYRVHLFRSPTTRYYYKQICHGVTYIAPEPVELAAAPANTLISLKAEETSSSNVSPFSICAQWTWENAPASDRSLGIGNLADHSILGRDNIQGLFPTRTAVILFGAVKAADEELGGHVTSNKPCVVIIQVFASRIEDIRRSASQLKVKENFEKAEGSATYTSRHLTPSTSLG